MDAGKCARFVQGRPPFTRSDALVFGELTDDDMRRAAEAVEAARKETP